MNCRGEISLSYAIEWLWVFLIYYSVFHLSLFPLTCIIQNIVLLERHSILVKHKCSMPNLHIFLWYIKQNFDQQLVLLTRERLNNDCRNRSYQCFHLDLLLWASLQELRMFLSMWMYKWKKIKSCEFVVRNMMVDNSKHVKN